jgi:chemotaxis protein CheD
MRRYPSTLPAGHTVVTLMPGDLLCQRESLLIGTILGSCVSVCLWDKRLRFGGMNHHLLPSCPSNAERSIRYGDVAVPELIRRMVDCGSHYKDIQAKMFGGASVLGAGSSEYSVGRRNVEVAVAELYRHGIPLIACRLSGTEGIAILQCTACGDVWVRAIGKSAAKAALPKAIQELPWTADRFSFDMISPDLGTPVALRGSAAPASSTPCPICCGVPKARTSS